MRGEDKTKQQLLEELAELQQRLAALENMDGSPISRADHSRRQTRLSAAEQERAKSQAILTAAIECLPFEFFALDAEGRYILQNATLRDHYGDALGKRPADYAPNEASRQLWLDNNRRAFAGERVEGEIEVQVQGATRYYYNIITPIRGAGELYGILGVNVDITERKQAEHALRKARDELEARVQQRTAELSATHAQLRQSHDELRAIYESLSDGLLVADRGTLRLLRANAVICSMLGYTPEELLSMSITSLHPPEVAARIAGALPSDITERLPGLSDVPMLRKDGSLFYVDITGATFTYHGRLCSLGLFRDVTQRRQAQAALDRERRSLEHLLRASDHERQLIAYDIHDGLAQELAGAIMQFQIYEQFQETQPGEARRAYDGAITLLRQGHSEARRLISGVRPPILDESGVVAAIAHLVHDPAFAHGPRVSFRSRVTFQRLDPVMENVIYRIVQEGLSNARNHSRSAKIVVSLLQRGERLRIEIRDWGVGFDPKQISDNRFGLDGIRERTRLLGGKCTIRSKPGEGAAVVVELPVVEGRSTV